MLLFFLTFLFSDLRHELAIRQQKAEQAKVNEKEKENTVTTTTTTTMTDEAMKVNKIEVCKTFILFAFNTFNLKYRSYCYIGLILPKCFEQVLFVKL